MENLLTLAKEWINQNREWLFSGAGLVVISCLWAAIRFVRSKRFGTASANYPYNIKRSLSSFETHDAKRDAIKPLSVRTTDGYLTQIGVLFEWRIAEPFVVLTNLGRHEDAEKKVIERLRYHLIENLESKSLSEIRNERPILSSHLLKTFQEEMRPFGVELAYLKIGRVIPIDQHA